MKKGFTLLELLIVVVILGVLALIAAPTLLNAADQAKVGAVKANVSAAASSVTSRLAVEGDVDVAAIAGAVAKELNDNNKNPIDSKETAKAFMDQSGAPTAKGDKGVVVIGYDTTTDTISINGYDKNGDSVLKLNKVVSAPQSAEAEAEAPAN